MHAHARSRAALEPTAVSTNPGPPKCTGAPLFFFPRRANARAVVVGIRPQCPTYWRFTCACAVRVIHRVNGRVARGRYRRTCCRVTNGKKKKNAFSFSEKHSIYIPWPGHCKNDGCRHHSWCTRIHNEIYGIIKI